MYKKANENESDKIFKLYKTCKKDLENKGILQWDDNYPTQELLKENIKKGNLYKIVEENKLVGTFVLNTKVDEFWTKIDWQNNNFLGLHLLAIKPKYQGKGFGKKVLNFCEEKVKEEGYKSIHLDVFSKNPAALKLYENNDYKKVGKLYFDFKPAGNRIYYCFEKIL